MSRPLEAADTQRYQTVYANAAAAGSVAAPTAGLHFTPELLDKLSAAGIKQSFVTLHVSAGTFQPITATNIADHVMHWEEFLVKTSAIRDVVRSLQLGRPIIPVGTTTTRVLESLYWLGARGLLEANPQSGQHTEASTLQQWEAYELADRFSDVLPSPAQALLFMAERGDRGGDGVVGGSTAICIAPGYTFRLCDALVTNFHQPHSTLMLLVGALMGESATRQMYAHAVQERYQFLSYGDACLITNRQQKDSNGVQADPPAPPTIGADMDAAKQSVLGDSDTALPPGTKVLLHSCCAPCSGAMIEQMRSEGHAVTILFYNPNIHPKEEYELRKDENKRYAKALDIPFVDLDYDTDEWFRQAQGMEFSPERGDRCTMCFDMRFARTAQYAQEHDFAVITTTNATSRWKDAEQVNASGARAVAQYDGVSWWFRDWQTEEMTQRKYKINAEERFYKQEYCGCIFSLRDTNAYRRKEGQDPVTIAGAQQYSDPAADSEEESLEAVRQFFNHTESAEEQQARELKEMYRERRKSARAVKENNW
jgi:predicted adenine nucleotide alpha hydrolase (AANH) superfamily ATPase